MRAILQWEKQKWTQRKQVNNMEKKVIDLSAWNEVQNYSAISSSGACGAIVKVINKSNNPDKRLDIHVNGLNKAGLPVIGGYTYTYANTIAKAKAAAYQYVKYAKQYGIKYMWLDIEDAIMTNLGYLLVDIIRTYKQYANEAGIGFGIYTGTYFYNKYIKPYKKELGNISFWFARYLYSRDYTVAMPVPSTKNLPKDVDTDGWQYTSKCIIPGIVGYTDLSVWYENAPFVNVFEEILVDYNPFTEPTLNVKLGTTGNDANWVEWYLWRFGKYTNADGAPDSTRIDGYIDMQDMALIKEVQKILGLKDDGIVGKISRTVWKKVC